MRELERDDGELPRAGVHADRASGFVGQFVRLCLQPASTKAKTICHSIRIDLGATIAVPVTSNVVASVVKGAAKTTKGAKAKTKTQISQAANAFASASAKGTKSTLKERDTTKKGTRR